MKTLSSYKPLLALLLIFCSWPLFSADFIQTNSGWLTSPMHKPVSVQAQMTGQVDPDAKTAELLLDINLEGDWKTYWRSPGEGGVAPTFMWQNESKNIKNINWFWPAPQRYPVLGVDTLGYKHQVHLPLSLELKDLNQPTLLKGRLTLASCTTICVLSDYDIELAFTTTDLVVDQTVAFNYAQAMGAVPILIDEEQINAGQESASITAITPYWNQTKQQLIVQVKNQFNWQQPDVFVDLQNPDLDGIFFSTPKVEVQGKTLNATFDVSSWAGEVNLTKTQIHTTVVDNNIVAELIAMSSDQPLATQSTTNNLLSMFLIALLGGVILNIMPCVLPVLGMKLSSILGAHGIQKSHIRKQFLASSLGILTSFWLLALFLLTLKLSGEALGWGIQFQNPYFIATMVAITALFAANMLGLFEIQLPSSMQTWLATKGDQSYLGHYLQGMFATLLATPCSAPFLGTAVAFALGASTIELFAIFSALGLGMALPWLLIALFPSIAQLLPKPGKWMGTVKLIFALMILATSLWLISLLSSFIGLTNVIVLTLILLVLLFVLIAKKHGKKTLLISLAALLIFGAIGLLISSLTAKHWATPLATDLQWQPLDTARLKQHVEAGKTVFVDVTADWCVTCKANKIGVILQDPIYSALQADNVILMKGDWTVRSDNVTDYLQSYGRYGVPFNIVYGPTTPLGIELSTILSSDAVLDALAQSQE
ncbi:protein-disulfide reductase DsbD domain-containing protein [Psychromonas sp. psych-6C06]|uniref:protein-disulfide reductase DsbD family protein n=1 Tax=Psychromonas sp. psych-6C06 TaxID=2058089 RepID=UPI001EE780DB|nr:protein-disulfide reductase DsbD domain-containing protein [Psychromonas sp. psych-6C06]